MTEEDTFRRLKRIPNEEVWAVLSNEMLSVNFEGDVRSEKRALEILKYISKRAPDFGWTGNSLAEVKNFQGTYYCVWKKPLKN